MIKIVLTNNKGGVTKTTSTLNLGYALANANKKVALIDFDSQKNMSINLIHTGGSNLSDVLKKKSISKKDFATTNNDNLYILPNNGDVSIQLFSQFESDEQPYLLLDCLEQLPKDTFDIILIDTPPNLELQTVNSLIASNYALIPATLETNSIIGVQNTLNSINRIKSRLNPCLKLIGVFISKYDERLTSTNSQMQNDLLEILQGDDHILTTKIRTNSNFSKNQMIQQSIFEDKNDRRGAEDYTELAAELLKIIN